MEDTKVEEVSTGVDTETEETVTETGDTQGEGDYTSPTVAELFGSAKTQTKTEVETPKVETKVETKKEDTSPKVEAKAGEVKTETPDELAALRTELENAKKERDGFKSAMFEERRKRQEREETTPKEEEAQPVFVDEDTQKYVQAQIAQVKQEALNAKVQASVAMVEQQFPDYKAVSQPVLEDLQQNPELLAQVMAKPNPALWVYQEGKNRAFSQKYGNHPDEIRTKMRTELESELRKQIEEELMGKVSAKAKQPTNLSKVRTSGGNSDSDWKPASVSDIYGR